MQLPGKDMPRKGAAFCAGISFCLLAAAQAPPLPADLSASGMTARNQASPPVLGSGITVPSRQEQDTYGIFSRQYGDLLVKDFTHTLSAPARWDAEEWKTAGLAAAAILGTGLLLDRPIRDAVQRNQRHGFERIATIFEPFGRKYSLGVLGGFYLAGTLGDNARAMHVAQDGIASTLIASVVITPVLLYVIGRSRPSANQGVADFHPFRSSGSSFPSDHATQAFAVATVISSHYDIPWVKTVSYGSAGLVGFARIYRNAHFSSYVLAGALIGSFVGHSVVAYNERRRNSGSGVAFMPMIAPGASGLMIQVRF
jgi:membrane-associated phospholipid phosphatase